VVKKEGGSQHAALVLRPEAMGGKNGLCPFTTEVGTFGWGRGHKFTSESIGVCETRLIPNFREGSVFVFPGSG